MKKGVYGLFKLLNISYKLRKWLKEYKEIMDIVKRYVEVILANYKVKAIFL